MGKRSGMGSKFYVGGYDISNDVNSLSRINSSRSVIEDTGIDVEAFERLHTHRDGGIEFATTLNKATGREFDVLKTVPSVDRHLMYVTRQALGAPAAACVCKQLSYDGNRGTDGSMTWSVAAESNGYGLEWGELLTAGKRTDTAATNGTGVDFAASTAFGLQAYLQLFSFTGTSVTVKLQESSDNGVGDAWADVTGGGFTVVTVAPAVQRIQTARTQTVERYLRVVTTGTFSDASFAVSVVKNQGLTNF